MDKYIELIIILVFLVPPAIALISTYFSETTGSDHYYHRLVIDSIRSNNRRFVSRLNNFMANNEMFYPQLLHWLLALTPQQITGTVASYSSALFNLLSSASLFWFVWELGNLPDSPLPYDHHTTLLIGMIYVLTPYSYDMENAKNISVSARGLGLFLGQLTLYLCTLYYFSNDFAYLLTAIIPVLLIYMSSQFAIQFILFSFPLFAILSHDYYLFFLPLASLLLYFIILPKIAYLSFKGQLGHKTLYFKYLAKKFILKYRYSIWRDFVKDFWVILFEKSELRWSQRIGYIVKNPLVILITAIPFLLPLLYVIFLPWHQASNAQDLYTIGIPIFVSLLIFFGTSFRLSRFLGEPERYVEFTIGYIAILSVMAFSDSTITYAILIYAGLSTALRLTFYLTSLLKKRSDDFISKLESLKKDLLKELAEGANVRLLCNNTQASKVFFSKDINLFWVTLSSEMTGSLHFNEIFKDSYHFIDEYMVAPIIKEFDINYLLLDTNLVPEYKERLKESGYRYTQLGKQDEFILYKVTIG